MKKNYEYICSDLIIKIPYNTHEDLCDELYRICDIFADMYLGIYGAELTDLKEALEDEDFEVVMNGDEND